MSLKLKDLIEPLELTGVVLVDVQVDVAGAYTSDLLSDVMANAPAAGIWITLQGHQNIIAVASLRELSAVIITGGHQPAPETVSKARQEGVNLLTSQLNSFEVSGRLYELLKRR